MSDYLDDALTPKRLDEIATATSKLVRKLNVDVLAVRGLSGTLVAAACAALYSIPFVVVRKDTESSHGSELEAPDRAEYKSWMILDDFIVSGKTVNTIAKAVDFRYGGPKGCKGMALYKEYGGYIGNAKKY